MQLGNGFVKLILLMLLIVIAGMDFVFLCLYYKSEHVVSQALGGDRAY